LTTATHRYECEKRLRQEAEDKHCQILDKLGFDARMHDQVANAQSSKVK